jgi:ABC-type transport system involved in multi-copper enzyme maturation permease subunit
LFIGPVFTREALILPRRIGFYVTRTAYVFVLLVLMSTAWLILTGTQIVRNVGDLARFGAILFQILAPLQLTLALLFSALLTASAVAQEKDRRTLTLLLLTRMSNAELVLGKLLASLLPIVVMLLAALPLFVICLLFGGVSIQQVARVFAVTLMTVLAAGSLGSTLALWREKTFQALAMTALTIVFWLIAWEVIAAGLVFDTFSGHSARAWAVLFSPWQAILRGVHGSLHETTVWLGGAVTGYLVVAAGIAVGLNSLAMLLIRVWNPTRETQPRDESQHADVGGWDVKPADAGDGQRKEAGTDTRGQRPRASRARHVWDNPILWREVRTWAYGRKILVVRAAYVLLVAIAAAGLYAGITAAEPTSRMASTSPDQTIITAEAKPLVPILVVSLILINAMAVTSLTMERDGKAIDLLLVTDMTPREFIFGKLGGVFYNSKEMILLPMFLCGYLWWSRHLTGENLVYLLGAYLVMVTFVTVLGLHTGMMYANSRHAIGVSVGTVLFLFLGIATCIRMMIAFSGSFQVQLQPFLAFMLGGGIGLYVSLGARNPSPAIGLASFLAPFATFYVITSLIIGYPLASFLVTVATYGFATAAMLIPALYEFDVATGRTTRG